MPEIELVRLPTHSPLPCGLTVDVARPTRSILRFAQNDNVVEATDRPQAGGYSLPNCPTKIFAANR